MSANPKLRWPAADSDDPDGAEMAKMDADDFLPGSFCAKCGKVKIEKDQGTSIETKDGSKWFCSWNCRIAYINMEKAAKKCK